MSFNTLNLSYLRSRLTHSWYHANDSLKEHQKNQKKSQLQLEPAAPRAGTLLHSLPPTIRALRSINPVFPKH